MQQGSFVNVLLPVKLFRFTVMRRKIPKSIGLIYLKHIFSVGCF